MYLNRKEASMKNYIAILLGILLLCSCAKDRPIQRLLESGQTELRISKSAFNVNTQWYSKVTVVKRSDNGALTRLFVGNQSKLRVGYFQFSRNLLKFYDAVTRYNSNSKATADELLYSWNISHSEYHLKPVNGEVTNVEEENDTIAWGDKNFFRVNFAAPNLSGRHDISATDSKCWEKKFSSLVEGSLKASPEHISYVVEEVYEYKNVYWCRELPELFEMDPTFTAHLKYSFKPRKKSNYEPYVYTGEKDPLIKKYGFFKTKVTGYGEKGKLETEILMNRWDPKKTHRYFIDKSLPEKYKVVFTHPTNGVFARINDILKQTGEPIRFEISDDPAAYGCTYGDVGCSFIKIIEEQNPGAPWGYGPSDADPQTGEIIAGNAHVWAGKMRYYVDHYFKTKLEYERFAPENSTLFALMKKTLGEKDIEKWTSTAAPLLDYSNDIGNAYHFLLPEFTYVEANYNYTTYVEEFVSETSHMENRVDFLIDQGILKTSFKEQFSNKISGVILKDEDVSFGINTLYGRNINDEEDNSTLNYGVLDSSDRYFDSVRALALVGKSTEELFNAAFYHTAIHEVGHTLNLEHNFYGSVDKKNLRAPFKAVDFDGNPIYQKDVNGDFVYDGAGEKIQEIYQEQSTSVMEYAALKNEMHEFFDYGDYDKAALVYAYSSGKVDSSKDFLFCTHGSVEQSPMCNMHDYGTTPSQIVLSYIKEYEYGYPIRNYRQDRAFWDTSGYGYQRYLLMKKLKSFLKMYFEAFKETQMLSLLANKSYSTPLSQIHGAIEADLKQAVKLTIAFYDAVLHQKKDRSFRDTYDDGYGNLVKKGIWADKRYAMEMLFGSHYMGISPTRGETVTTYLTLLDDDDMKEMFLDITSRALLDQVDEYVDTDIYRAYLIANSASDSGVGVGKDDFKNVELIGVSCYRERYFASRFGIDIGDEDVKKFSMDANDDRIPSTWKKAAIDGKVNVIAAKADEKVYVAVKKRNLISYKTIEKLETVKDYGKIQFRDGFRKLGLLGGFYNTSLQRDYSYCQGLD